MNTRPGGISAMADGPIPTNHPTQAEFSNAVAVITGYIEDPRSGWEWVRGESVLKQLNDWQMLLFKNRMYASHDAEKS